MSMSRAARVGRWLCLGAASLGTVGLAGALFKIEWLRTVVPDEPPMMANTGIALVLLGAAGALRDREALGPARKTLSWLAAIIAFVIAAITLAEYAFEHDLYIDQWFVRDLSGPHAGRPSPPTALAVALLAAAVPLLDTRPKARARPSEWLILAAALIAFTSFAGMLFGAGPLYRLTRAPVIGVSLLTALSLLLTSLGLLLQHPSAGVMRVVTAPGLGGVLLRRLIYAATLSPLLLGLAVTRVSAAAGIIQLPVVVAILTATLTVVTLVLLGVSIVPLNRTYEALESSRTSYRNLVEKAPDGIFVANIEGRYTDVNDAGARMLGYMRDEIVGKTIVDLISRAEADRLWRVRQRLLEGAISVEEWSLRKKDGEYIPVEVSASILPDGRWQGFVRDISERKRLERLAEVAQEQLRESEARFRLAFEEAPIGMALIALDGTFARVNRALCEIVRYGAAELVGQAVSAITYPDDRSADAALALQLGRREITRYQLEKRCIRKDGAIVNVIVNGSLLRDRAGEPLYYVAQIEDVTSRKQLENELRLSEAKSTGILSISADAIISVDEQQRIVLFNEGAQKIFGYARAEALGAPLDLLLPERFHAAHRAHVTAFSTGSDIARRMGKRDAAIVGRRKNGEEFPADAAVSKLEVAGTRLLTVVLRDVTEQQRSENELRFLAELGPVFATTLDYEQTLSKIAEIAVRDLADLCIVDLVDERDAAKVRRLRVVCRCPAQAELRNLLQKARLGRERRDFVWTALEDRRPVLRTSLSRDDIAALCGDDAALLLPASALDIQSGMALPLVVQGKLLGVIALLSAAPARIYGPDDLRMGQELAHRAALAVENARLYRTARNAVQVRDDVLGIVAHDLRNPLGTISLQADLLRRSVAEPDQKLTETIKSAATRMNRLIQDLLDVARMEAGALAIERNHVPAAQLLSEAVDQLLPQISTKSIELRIEFDEDLPELCADRERMLQVLDNLLGNALKFTDAGGCISVGARARADEVLFWVRDTGPGIATEDQPHVFDRFWQARRAGRHGAGLGLPITKGIIDAHGGHIWIESSLGRGSTFYFTIPTVAGRAHEVRHEPARHAS